MFEGPEGVAVQLEAVLDALATAELRTLPVPALLDRVRDLVAARNRLDAELARTVREAELTQAFAHDGMVSARSWLRGHCRLSAAAAGQLVRNGRALAQLPVLAAAHAAGRVTADQLTVVARVVEPAKLALAEAHGVDLAGVDAVLAEHAATRPHAELAPLVHHYLELLDPDGPEPDPTVGRSFALATHPDGRVTGRFDLDPVGGEKVRAVIESMVQADRPAGDERSREQQQGDALVQWADNTLASGSAPKLRGVKPHVALRVGIEDLIDPATNSCAGELGFGAVVSGARARWVACDAEITRIVLDPDGLPLDVGRRMRLVPPWLRTAVEARDGRCVFAGCEAPAWWCEVHHLIAWMHGGETSLDNSGLLCERHHTQVHHGFRVHRDELGFWHTYRPDATEILVPRPEPDDAQPDSRRDRHDDPRRSSPELARAG